MSRWLGLVLIGLGLCVLAFGALWQFGVWPGSQPSVPPPVALEQSPSQQATAARAPTRPPSVPTGVPTAMPTAPPALTIVPLPTPASMPAPLVADADDRASREPLQTTGYAVHLAIPSIGLDTPVVQGGIVNDARGNAIWQTLPFVAVHYGDLTSLLGADGNAVISGHVVTTDEGNVFRLLYQVGIDDHVEVWDEREREYDYHVVEVKLVSPSDVSVMDPTPDQTLTLITCGGTFDRVHRQFSQRLIVTAKPLHADQDAR